VSSELFHIFSYDINVTDGTQNTRDEIIKRYLKRRMS